MSPADPRRDTGWATGILLLLIVLVGAAGFGGYLAWQRGTREKARMEQIRRQVEEQIRRER